MVPLILSLIVLLTVQSTVGDLPLNDYFNVFFLVKILFFNLRLKSTIFRTVFNAESGFLSVGFLAVLKNSLYTLILLETVRETTFPY